MVDEERWNRLLRGHVPEICSKCQNPLDYIGIGQYQCPQCGAVVLDDFGKIRQYLSVNGPTPAWKLSRELGIHREIIEQYIKNGSVDMRKKNTGDLNFE